MRITVNVRPVDYSVPHDDGPPSMVYFIADQEGELVKIGVSSNPERRLRTLEGESGRRLELLHTLHGGYALEAELHARFADYRVRGEWFRLAGPLCDFIRDGRRWPVDRSGQSYLFSLSEALGPTPREQLSTTAGYLRERALAWIRKNGDSLSLEDAKIEVLKGDMEIFRRLRELTAERKGR